MVLLSAEFILIYIHTYTLSLRHVQLETTWALSNVAGLIYCHSIVVAVVVVVVVVVVVLIEFFCI